MNRRPPESGPEAAAPEKAREQVPGGPSFEASIDRLGKIVAALENGDLPLEESLRLFEEGVKLSRASQARLDAAEKRVERLLAVDAEGNARTEPFATSAADKGERGGDEDVPF